MTGPPPGAGAFDRIVVPLGGTLAGELEDRGLHVARHLAARTRVPLRLLSVAPPGKEDEVGRRLAEVAERCPEVVRVDTAVASYGSIAKAIAGAAGPGTLLCMSSQHDRGRSVRALVGTITEEVVATVAQPVLLAGPHVPPAAGIGGGPIVACVDGPGLVTPTVEVAARWSRALGLTLRLVSVAPPDLVSGSPERGRLEHGLARLAERHDGAGWDVLAAPGPVPALVALAASGPVAVLVMATHGRQGWSRLLAGSVTAAVVHGAVVPVLVVPPGADVARTRPDQGADAGPVAGGEGDLRP